MKSSIRNDLASMGKNRTIVSTPVQPNFTYRGKWLAYLADSNPTLSGPELDVTIVPECSGINGLELFDYLLGSVMLLGWNRVNKVGL